MMEWTTETGPEMTAVRVGDPPARPVVSSLEDIGRALALRLQLRERYPDRPNAPSSYWWLGAD